ncbi:MAG: D-alanyl-D-alanine carboxypeptidase [Candidatus Berkelbacteria bacterium]|nr:D-alanyl-D-alanine carboxypeptidase [Candidatus Berkelbacteria bacterium]
MISQPLIILSIIYSLIGFSLFSSNLDAKISDFYSKENVSAVSAADTPIIEGPSKILLPVISPTSKPQILARNYALFDADSGKFLVGKNENQPVPIASTTKIMTAVVALENYSLDDVVTVPEIATQQIPTLVHLRVGEKISVGELLRCMLIQSGNDSAMAIASHLDGGSNNFQPFVDKMNQKAKELGMMETEYFDPAGLNDGGHSTASDLAKIARYAMQNSTFRQIVSTKEYTATNVSKTNFHLLENSNRLITTYDYPGAIGVKTGFTDLASHCLVAAATQNGHTLISIVLGTYANTATASADESRKLLDFGFANTSWK